MTHAHAAAPTDAVPVGDATLRRLRVYNAVMGVLHLVQAVAVVVLATDFTLPVTGAYLEGPPGTPVDTVTTIVDVRVAWGVAIFLLVSAVAHAVIVSPGVFGWYAANLRRGRNVARWVEYAVSSSVMMFLIAQVVGISDVAALVAIVGVNASMILFGWLQEVYERPGGSLLPFWFGCVAGVTPWVAVVLYVVSPGSTSDATAPGFVYGIVVSLFVFFDSFALNQWLQYRRVGRWHDYVWGEYVYVGLSLVAKSALAWQVFGGTLVG